MFLSLLVGIFIVLITLCCHKVVKNRNIWKERAVPYEKPHIFYGNYKPNPEKCLGVIILDLYRKFDGQKLFGFWRFFAHGIFVRDPQIIKTILTSDFNKFHDNDFKMDRAVDPLTGNNPFFLSGEEWKKTRGHLVPSLTVSKMKNYFSDMVKVSEHMIEFMKRCLDSDEFVELKSKELAGMYTTDVVANVVFGVDNNTFENRDNVFHNITNGYVEDALNNNFKMMLALYFPQFASLLRLRFISKEVENIVLNLSKRILEHKRIEKSERKDFFQSMLELRKNDVNNEITDEFIGALAFSFVLDGYETSGDFIILTLSELAWNPKVQDKLRNEINDMLKESGGQLDYEKLINLKYLEQVCTESLRLHPPAYQLQKVCTTDSYTLQVNDHKTLEIKRGTLISIPIIGIHRDPQFYEDPESFIPERFEEGMEKFKYFFLPFGDGPRICPGRRYAMAQSKLAIAKILVDFRLKPCPDSKYPIEYETNALLLRPSNGAPLRFYRI